VLGGKNDGVIVGLQEVIRHACKCQLLASEHEGSSARYARTVSEFGDLMLRKLGTRANEAHIPNKNIQKLRELI
jgi:hypothetical protein